MKLRFVGTQKGFKIPAYRVQKIDLVSEVTGIGLRNDRWVQCLALLAVLLVSGCATNAITIPGGAAHPADPSALQAPLPPKSKTLSSEIVQPPEPVKGGHNMHGMKHGAGEPNE